jgi:TolA-binding protein
LLSALALGGCAANAASRQDVEALKADVQTLREQQRDQQREIARLRAELQAQKAAAPAAPSASAGPTRLEKAAAATRVGASSPYAVPDDLQVVRLEPEAVEFSDETTPQAPVPPARHHAALPPAGPLPMETPLKEPLLADLAPQAVPDTALLDVQYKVALSAPNAMDQLEAFAKSHPEHASADNALFEAGLRAEKAGDATRAAKDFDLAVRQHPAGDTVADSLLHLAACDLQLHRTGAARHALEQLSTQYPDSAQAEAARVRLADLPH